MENVRLIAGIQIEDQNGAVVIERVISSGNYGSGLYLTGQEGTYGVTITNSEFDQNNDGSPSDNYGIRVISHGLVTLNYVSANHNNGMGARIETERGMISNGDNILFKRIA